MGKVAVMLVATGFVILKLAMTLAHIDPQNPSNKVYTVYTMLKPSQICAEFGLSTILILYNNSSTLDSSNGQHDENFKPGNMLVPLPFPGLGFLVAFSGFCLMCRECSGNERVSTNCFGRGE